MAERAFKKTLTYAMALAAVSRNPERELIGHAAYVRGIEPKRVRTAETPLGDVHYMVIGPQNDDQGYDADGAPTMEYPGDTQPFHEDPFALRRLE